MSYNNQMICDPSSRHHTVKLYPGQDLCLRLMSEPEDLEIDPFIKINKTKNLPKGTEIIFSIDPTLIKWSEDCSVFVGNIYGKTRNGSEFRLIVSLISTNDYRKDVVTVYNPKDAVIKLEPYQILDIVVSDPCFSGSDFWEFDFEKSQQELDLDMRKLGTRIIPLAKSSISDIRDRSDIYHVSAKTSMFYHPSCREHHNFFRFSNGIMPMVRTKPDNVYYVGKILIKGNAFEERYEDFTAVRSLEILVNLKSKFSNRTAQIIGIRDYDDVSSNPGKAICLPTIVSNSQKNRKVETTSKKYDYKHSSAYSTYGSGTSYGNWRNDEDYWGCYSDYSHYHTYGKKKSVRRIEIKYESNPVLGSNCISKSLLSDDSKESTALLTCGKDWKESDFKRIGIM